MIRFAIFFLVFVLLFFLFKRYKEDKTFTREIAGTLALMLLLIFVYQYKSNKVADRITELLVAFKEGKVLLCHDKDVDKKSFDFESGTMVFISKKIVDIKYPITSCKVKK